MFIEARLATEIRPNAVIVPEDAIVPLEGSTYLWVIKDGKADRRQVTLGVRTAGWAEIIGGGVDAGDQVVVGGAERLFPGAKVMAQVVERRRGQPTGAESTAAKAGDPPPGPAKP
jgi:membrane fusion protein (multidrug efflux system)